MIAPLVRGARLFARATALLLAAGPALALPDIRMARGAEPDTAVSTDTGIQAFALPGLGEDFVFVGAAEMVQYVDGSARLTGIARRMSDHDQEVALDLRLSDGRRPGDLAYPPANAPDKQLLPAAYVENGGPIDPMTWTFYVAGQGELVGFGALSGMVLDVQQTGTAFQVGFGASNRNLRVGASCAFQAQVLQQPSAGPALPGTLPGGSLRVELDGRVNWRATGSDPDPAWTRARGRRALVLPGIGTDFNFVAGGELVELSDGTAQLAGVVAARRNPTLRFAVDLRFGQRVSAGEPTNPPLGSPKKALAPGAYVENGGPIDASTWRYYETTQGTLIGLEAFEGFDLAVTRIGPAFQVGVGANGVNLRNGGSGWIAWTPLGGQQQALTGKGGEGGVGDLYLDLDRDLGECVEPAEKDPRYYSGGAGHALYAPGIGKDFVFSSGGQFVELADGTARLTGVVERASAPTQRFMVDVVFSGRLDPGMPGYAPPMSPKKELASTAYVPNGPVDPSHWHYYEGIDGTLTGLDAFDGALVQVKRRGPAFQVGVGANGKNTRFGGSGWLDLLVLTQPSQGKGWKTALVGDFNLDLGRDCRGCPRAAYGDPGLGVGPLGDTAFWLPGIATDLEFESGALWIEHADGTATLAGVVRSLSNPLRRFAVHLELDQRVDPGDPEHAPAGSPKKELPPAVYLENGGPIDAETWHYYMDFEGSLTGLDDFAGGLLHVTRRGPALQVGLAASGRNLRYGASGWLDVDVLSQPGQGQSWPAGADGDVNIDLGRGCP
jgi:hypothetical protein